MQQDERRLKHPKNHSSKSEQTTRVKSSKKQAKKTVGITISPKLVAEARKHKLNISKITEQALSSILEYLQTQKENESSKYSLSRGSFLKESRAGSSVWYERRLRKAEAAGSNPARSTFIMFKKGNYRLLNSAITSARILESRMIRMKVLLSDFSENK